MTNEIEKNDLIIPCSCGEDSFLRFIKFENIEGTDTEIKGVYEIYVSITGQEIYSIKDKLKAIWSILTRGEYENFGIIVNQESKDKIKDFFTNGGIKICQ